MEDDSQGFDQTIKEENAGMEYKGSESKCLKSSGWTDEKHMNYLSSVEQSFVDELNNKYCKEMFDGLHQRTKLACRSNNNELLHGKLKTFKEGVFKVIRVGISEKKNEPNEGEIKMLLSNAWIQRRISSKDHRLRDPEARLSEMSDQNFGGEETEDGMVSNMMFSKKRSRGNTSGSD